MSFGVYIHFPYCARRCPYCDFAIHVRREIPHDRYEAAVVRELSRRAEWFAGRRLASIYFGGGTPSLWRPDCVARVIAAVRATFCTHESVEVTLEANPDRLDGESLRALRDAGVNRLSLGAQTFSPRHLAALGRDHSEGDTRRAFAAARAAGFDNLSLDLIHALPEQTDAELDADLDALADLAPEHLSVYALTVEDRTPFGAWRRAGTLAIAPPEREADQFERIDERLAAAGYAHYEVSSYARAGRRAVHNSLYWTGGEWLGLGMAAHSFRRTEGGGERFANLRPVARWFAAVESGSDELALRERLDDAALAREAVWLGLRLLEDGVNRARFAERFDADPVAHFASAFARLEAAGLVTIDPARARLTRRGALLADEVAARFL